MENNHAKSIDYRKDTPPTDWLSKRVQRLIDMVPDPPTPKDLGLEFMSDLLEELESLRCQDPCPTQNGTDPTSTAAPADQPCICGLIDRISDIPGEWVPKDEFVATLQPFGYHQETALKKYSTYALKKIRSQYSDEFKRLGQEADNAYNWDREFEHDASSAMAEALDEFDELMRRCDRELEQIMAE